MTLVDTHAHLNFSQFKDDIDVVRERAGRVGVHQIVNVGTNLEISRAAIALAESGSDTVATVGFHPHNVEAATDELMTALVPLADHPKVVAVGETGLDFFRDYAPWDRQEQVFRFHIALAADRDLPLVVHSRGAETRVLDLLEEFGATKTCLHCFGGTEEEAARAVGLGYHLGFGGTLTYKRSDRPAVLARVPRERVLLETDCPFLAPVPHRGKRNEPAFVRVVAEYVAELTNDSTEHVAEQTTENARIFFRLGA